MKNDEIQMEIMRLENFIQDLDSEISTLNLPEDQVTSAKQLHDLSQRKNSLISKRHMYQNQIINLKIQITSDNDKKSSNSVEKISFGSV